jgi:hypothetical protein
MDIQNIKGVAPPKIISHCTEVGKVSQKINQFNPFKTFQRDGGNYFGGTWHWSKREKKILIEELPWVTIGPRVARSKNI